MFASPLAQATKQSYFKFETSLSLLDFRCREWKARWSRNVSCSTWSQTKGSLTISSRTNALKRNSTVPARSPHRQTFGGCADESRAGGSCADIFRKIQSMQKCAERSESGKGSQKIFSFFATCRRLASRVHFSWRREIALFRSSSFLLSFGELGVGVDAGDDSNF